VWCGPWVAEYGRRLILRYFGSDLQAPGEDLDALRAMCVAAWQSWYDRVSAGDERADEVLDRFSLR
jgi:hypothetical protein